MAAKILVIEDNPDNRELMTYLLEAFGHEVDTAEDGEQALAVLEHTQYDLIVCDVHLPKVDGFEVIATLRRRDDLGAMPVVAVTALAMVGDRDRLLTAGFDAYIGKPIEAQHFVTEIEACLERNAAT